MSIKALHLDNKIFYTSKQCKEGPSLFPSPLEKKERVRGGYLEHVEENLKDFRLQGEKKIKRFETAAKVIRVITTLLLPLMCISMLYLPAWVTWGIGLPSIIIFSVIQAKLVTASEAARRRSEHLFHSKEFLESHAMDTLQPIGEWDLDPIDKRLKSDEMVQEELKKKHPPSGREIVESFKDCDLELHAVATRAGYRFSYLPNEEGPKGVSLPVDYLDYPVSRLRGKLEEVLRSYQILLVRFKLCLQEAVKLRGSLPELETKKESINQIKEKLESAVELFKKQKPIATEEELFIELKKLESEGTILSLQTLRTQVRQLYEKIKSAVQALPEEQLPRIERDLESHGEGLIIWEGALKEELKEQNLETINKRIDLGLQNFKTWLDKHPNELSKCIEVVHQLPLDRAWVEKNYKMLHKKPQELYDSLQNIYTAWREAVEGRRKLNELWSTVAKLWPKPNEELQAFKLEWASFHNDKLARLQKLIGQEGVTSKLKLLGQALFTKKPAAPFFRGKRPDGEPLQERRIQEIKLNRMLKALDGKMLRANRIRKVAFIIPQCLLLLAETICLIYLTTNWYFLGFCVANLILAGASTLVDRRYLFAMNQRKQRLKIRQILKDRPLICKIPGTRTSLKEVQSVQQRWELDSPEETWGRVLIEGDQSLPQSKKEAREIIENMAPELNRATRRYFKKRLKDPKVAKDRELVGLIKSSLNFKPAVQPKKTMPLEKPSEKYGHFSHDGDGERLLSLKRNWREGCQKMQLLHPGIALLLKKIDIDFKASIETAKKVWETIGQLVKTAPKIPLRIKQLTEYRVILRAQHDLIQQALPGNHVRDSKERVGSILQEIEKFLKEYQGEWDAGLDQKLLPYWERLKKLAVEHLHLGLEKVARASEKLPRAERALLRLLIDSRYTSKENSKEIIALVSKAMRSQDPKRDRELVNTLLAKGYTTAQTLVRQMQGLYKEMGDIQQKFPEPVKEKESQWKLTEVQQEQANLINLENAFLKLEVQAASETDLQNRLKSQEPKVREKAIRSFKEKYNTLREKKINEVRERYFRFNLIERESIYGFLPPELCDELKGGRLLGWCHRIKESQHIQKWNKFGNRVIILFKRIEPALQHEIYAQLPQFFKEKLEELYKECTGLKLVELCEKCPEEEVKFWVEDTLAPSFFKLPVEHQEKIYSKLPENVRVAFKEIYEERTGRALIRQVQKQYNELLKSDLKLGRDTNKLSEILWDKLKDTIKPALQKVDEPYRRRTWDNLALFSKFLKSL